MLSTLRSRLWLTYILLIVVVLSIVGTGTYLALIRNPLIYRQAIVNLRVAEAALQIRLENQPNLSLNALINVAQRQAERYGVRILLLDAKGSVLVDTGSEAGEAQLRLPSPLRPTTDNLAQVSSLRDTRLRVWLYTLAQVNENRYLLTTVQRPHVALRAIISDRLFLPLTAAGGVALLLAFLLAWLMARWISAPLGRISAAAGKVAAGQAQPIPLEGPAEVKNLAQAFNEMTRRVQVSQQSQRDFVANVSHELKTPLTSIQGFAQAIQDGAASTPEAVKFAVSVIQTEIERMYRLVQDLLALARLDAGTADLRKEPVDLNELLKAVTLKFQPQAGQAKVNLSAEMGSLPVITGDGDRLAQVFSNLIDNAIKYTPDGGSVRIEGQQTGKSIEISVIDTGSGIPQEEQERIFERFYQADKSRRGGSGRGTGLGLAIARQIVQAEGGSITVQSHVGQGSRFVVRLPVK
jgi:signal transduction histidine kinase